MEQPQSHDTPESSLPPAYRDAAQLAADIRAVGADVRQILEDVKVLRELHDKYRPLLELAARARGVLGRRG